jgi:hypothetical protein
MRLEFREVEELKRRLLALPDRELARMVFAEPENYREEALEIARAELDRRRVSAEILSTPPVLVEDRPIFPPDPIRTDELLPLWIGFAGTGLVFAAEVAVGRFSANVASWVLPIWIATFATCVYWTACVHRIHRLLGEATNGGYPITPGRAAGDHFIPLYHLYWIFAWPLALENFFASYDSGTSLPGTAVGFAILISAVTMRTFDCSIGLVLVFATMAYIYARVRRAGARSSVSTGVPDWSSRARV